MKTGTSLYRWVLALIVLSFAVTAVMLSLMPARVPMHYNAAGEVDRIGSKYENLLFPAIIALTGGAFLALAHHVGKRNASQERLFLILALCLCAVWNVLFLTLMIKGARLAAGRAAGIDISKLAAILLGALLIVTGNFMPKATRNALFGLRTTWSTKNDIVWQRCQRFGGYSGIAAGVLILLLACFLSSVAIGIAMLVVILLWTVVCTLGSRRIYLRWQREQDT